LKRKFDAARKDNAIQPDWHSFNDLPIHIRGTVLKHSVQVSADNAGDFKMNYPWYFQYKELASPRQSFERPPIRPRVNRPEPVRDSTTPAPAPPAARSRRRLPPSPSPSDHSSSSFSSSPPQSPSPSPYLSPSPPHVASLLRMSLTSRPDLEVQGSSSASVVPSGPRPHIRPNAVASSSREPIKVEPSPSSSSASPASDIHHWSGAQLESHADPESEHEMENDTGHVPHGPRVKSESSAPLEPTTTCNPVAQASLKRPQPSDSPTPPYNGPSKRHKVRSDATSSTPSDSESDTASDDTIADSEAKVQSGYDYETDETRSSSHESGSESEGIAHDQQRTTAGCPGCRDRSGLTPLKQHICRLANTYISRLKAAVMPVAPEVLYNYMPLVRARYTSAQTEDAKAIVLSAGQDHLFARTIDFMVDRR
jgi:hypothetical protein